MRPSIVYLKTEVSGWLKDTRDNKHYTLSTEPQDQPLSFDTTCTGFGVNPNGYIATAGHCVDNRPGSVEGFNGDLVKAFAADQQRMHPELDLATLTEAAARVMTTEGLAPGSPLDVKVIVGGVGPQPLPARVVDFRSIADGDVALLKIEATDLPSLQLATDANVQVGTSVLSVGYPGVVTSMTDPSLEPSIKDGEVSSKKTSNNLPVYEISAPMEHGMSGGPAVDLSGRVLGLNSRGPNETFNLISPATVLAELLARNGVRNEVGPDEATYRAALDAYYSGRYTEAYAGFDRLTQINPRYDEANKFKIEAARARDRVGDVVSKRPPPPSQPSSKLPFGMSPVLFWSLIGGATALLIGGVSTAVVTRKRRQAPSSLAAPAPAGQYAVAVGNPYAQPAGPAEASQVYARPYPPTAPPPPPAP